MTKYITFSVYIKHFFLINLIELLALNLLFYTNSQLTIKLGYLHDVQRKRKKLHDILQTDITIFWHFQKLRFWQNCKKMFKQLNFAS